MKTDIQSFDVVLLTLCTRPYYGLIQGLFTGLSSVCPYVLYRICGGPPLPQTRPPQRKWWVIQRHCDHVSKRTHTNTHPPLHLTDFSAAMKSVKSLTPKQVIKHFCFIPLFLSLICFTGITWPSVTIATAAFSVSCVWSTLCLMKVTCWRTWTLCATATLWPLTLVHLQFVTIVASYLSSELFAFLCWSIAPNDNDLFISSALSSCRQNIACCLQELLYRTTS